MPVYVATRSCQRFRPTGFSTNSVSGKLNYRYKNLHSVLLCPPYGTHETKIQGFESGLSFMRLPASERGKPWCKRWYTAQENSASDVQTTTPTEEEEPYRQASRGKCEASARLSVLESGLRFEFLPASFCLRRILMTTEYFSFPKRSFMHIPRRPPCTNNKPKKTAAWGRNVWSMSARRAQAVHGWV